MKSAPQTPPAEEAKAQKSHLSQPQSAPTSQSKLKLKLSAMQPHMGALLKELEDKQKQQKITPQSPKKRTITPEQSNRDSSEKTVPAKATVSPFISPMRGDTYWLAEGKDETADTTAVEGREISTEKPSADTSGSRNGHQLNDFKRAKPLSLYVPEVHRSEKNVSVNERGTAPMKKVAESDNTLSNSGSATSPPRVSPRTAVDSATLKTKLRRRRDLLQGNTPT